jgi:hypothetical protein
VVNPEKREAQDAPLFDHACTSQLEISGALFMAAITIEFDRLACTLAGGAAVFAAWLRRTGTNGVLTLFLFVLVCHGSS